MLFNPILETSVLAWLVAQVLKVIFELATKRRLNFSRMVGAGGMPSSHSAFVTGLTVSVGLVQGWHSAELAISLVFALVVMYDAAGVRQAAGQQARILNEIVAHLQDGSTILSEKEKLKELLGHTPVEVFIGAVLGAVIAFIVLA